jgi:hypothetical protein
MDQYCSIAATAAGVVSLVKKMLAEAVFLVVCQPSINKL